MKELTHYLPITEWSGVDGNIEISLGEYGYAIAQIDEDEYAVVAGVRVDDNCNYTGFYCETFCYKEWNKMAHDPKDWPGRTIKSAMLDPMGVADMDEYDKEYNSPTSLFYDLLHAYGFENLFTNAWGYEEFTLAEVLACIESDNKKINEKKAA